MINFGQLELAPKPRSLKFEFSLALVHLEFVKTLSWILDRCLRSTNEAKTNIWNN